MPALDNIALATPELILSAGILVLLMAGVFSKSSNSWMSEAVLALLGVTLVSIFIGAGSGETFNGSFVVDGFASFLKVLTLLAAAGTIALSLPYRKIERLERFELPVVLALATLGMLIMISANDLISLYMAIELQSLALYVAVAVNRDSVKSSEASLKYFVLGALSSGMLLYGMSLIYGFTGSVTYEGIGAAVSGSELSLGLVFGLVFLLAGLAFKLAAVPFHMWTPDVYEGAPTSITAFLAAAPKLAAMAMLVRVLITAFPEALASWQQIVIAISLASMVLGAFAAIGQTSLKRLLAYSSIANIGFALVGLAAGTSEGVFGVLFYMVIYVVMTLGSFACVIALRKDGVGIETIDDLKGLSKTHPLIALTLLLLMFSFIGMPPLAGFWAKLYAFSAAVEAGLWWLAIIGIISSVVAAYYYLRIVKLMYFDEPERNYDETPGIVRFIIAICALIVSPLVLVALAPLEGVITAAANTLFL